MHKKALNYSFSQALNISIPRSVFNRSHNHITAFDSGYLVPVYVDEVLPGDTFKLKLNSFSRLATPVVPVMDNIYMDFHFFFVPNRLLWEHWEEMNGQRDKPNSSTDYLTPIFNSGDKGVPVGSLFDYMGVPPKVPHIEFNALFARAYNKIWNDHYRDENLQDPILEDISDKDYILDEHNINNYSLLRRNKKRDYFTSALPWPQKGNSAVINPIGNVQLTNGSVSLQNPMSNLKARDGRIISTPIRYDFTKYPDDGSGVFPLGSFLSHEDFKSVDGRVPLDSLTAENLTINGKLNSTPISINELRQAFQMQRLFERDARGGTRYNEVIKTHFGVDVPDYRLQRSEYLGGGISAINMQQVPQTSSTDKASPQANVAAYATQSANNIGFTRSFDEHGVLLCLASVRVDQKYQYGLPRMYSRRTRFDYYLPTLAHLGEQAILNKEIYASGNKDIDEKVFGYQERFSEYRYNPNRVSGKLRSVADQPLDFWHLAQKFDKVPMLNSEFVQSQPPLKRSLAVQNEPEVVSDLYFMIECTRPMPVYSIPGGIDRF